MRVIFMDEICFLPSVLYFACQHSLDLILELNSSQKSSSILLHPRLEGFSTFSLTLSCAIGGSMKQAPE
jgi:hypothetical protein